LRGATINQTKNDMKITKLSLVILAAAVGLVALSPALRAQPTNTPPAGGGRGARGGFTADAQLTRLETALGTTNKLSEAQLPKVKVVFEKQAKDMTALRPAGGGGAQLTQEERDAMTAKRAAITKEVSDSLKAILDPEQFKIYEALPQGGRGGGRRGGAGGGAPPAN
jgi:hypothetical protein